MLSSMRSRKQETSSPRWRLPALRNVGVAGWKRPSMISSTICRASFSSPRARCRATMHDAVLVALQEALAVERLQRVGRVELEGAQEGLEAELLLVRAVVELADEVHRVLVEGLALVVLVLHQVVELLFQVVEEHRVVVHVLQEVLVRSLTVGLELDLAVRAVQVQHGVELVVAQALVGRRQRGLLDGLLDGAALVTSVSATVVSKTFPILVDPVDVFGRAHEFEAVKVRHLAFDGDDVPGHAEVVPEIGVACADHSADQFPVLRVVEEPDDLLRHRALAAGPAVSGHHQHEGLGGRRAELPAHTAGIRAASRPSFSTKRLVFSEVEEK